MQIKGKLVCRKGLSNNTKKRTKIVGGGGAELELYQRQN